MDILKLYHPNIPEFIAEAAMSTEMHRLRNIGMNCGCEYTSFPRFRRLPSYSRFDHSLGAALIVWNFTHNNAQSLSALFHDIATPTFSHVIDFLQGDHMDQKSTESGTDIIIEHSPQLIALLAKLKLSVDEVKDYHMYPIADNDSPMLSADRLEYTIGNAYNFGLLDLCKLSSVYSDLIVGTNENGEPELIFQSLEYGRLFGYTALECCKIYICDEDRFAMQALADLLNGASRQGIITKSDLYETEKHIIQKLSESAFSDHWSRFCQLSSIARHKVPSNSEYRIMVRAKKRYIDPYIKGQGRLSMIDREFRENIHLFLSNQQDYWLIAT